MRQILSTISSFEKNNLVEKLRQSRERKSKKNKELGINLSRNGNGRCGGKRKLTDTIPNLSNLVLSYKKTKDIRTRKPLTNTKISKLLLEEHNLSVSYKSVANRQTLYIYHFNKNTRLLSWDTMLAIFIIINLFTCSFMQ